MYSHAFFTWVIANLLHPVVMLAFMEYDSTEAMFAIMLLAPLYSFAFSIPCLLAALLIVWIIDITPFDLLGKYLVWLITVSMLPGCFLLLVLAMRPGGLDDDIYDTIWFALPATIATAVTILIRTRYFFTVFALREQSKSLFKKPNQTKNQI